jgi:hypothetical protein
MGYKDPAPIILEDGPFNRMRDNYSPTSKVVGAWGLCQNAYPVAPQAGGATLGRPGYKSIGSRLGGVGTRTVQGVFQYEKKNGAVFVVGIVGGKFYTLNWATRVWTEVLTAAHFAAASGGAVTLSTTARISFLNFADVLVVSDGVNTPWTWDGTSGGGITKLTNAPVFYGQMFVYYGRMGGIKASDRATFVWSEPLQPNVGYEAGFANAWTFVQTDSSPITLMVGTNDELDVFRARSAGTATGKPDVNFASQGTREGLAEKVGTSSPWAYIQTEKAIVFLDSDVHPQMTRSGGNLIELWNDLYETIRQLPKSQAEKAIAVNYLPAQLFLFAVCDLGSSDPNLILVFNGAPDIPVPVAIWRGFTMTVLSMVENGDGTPTMIHGYDGWIYEHGNPEGTIWDDFDEILGTQAIEHLTESQPLGFDLKREMFFDRLDVSLYTASAMTVYSYYETPRGRSAEQAMMVLGGGAVFDVGLWDNVYFATSSQEEHKALGLGGEGRWIKQGFRHKELGQQFGINSFAVTAYPANTDPGVP